LPGLRARAALLSGVLLLAGARPVSARERARPAGAPLPGGRESAERAELVARAILPLTNPLSPMVRIPEGDFVMGSEENDVLEALADCTREPYGHRCTPTLFANEMPRHPVHLSSYWIDRFEVRVSDYERCVQIGRCAPRPVSQGTLRYDLPDLPVSRVTWNDARDYCGFRGARLPTEAEFERAARGLGARRYPWGQLWNSWASNHGRFGWDQTDAGDGFAELAPVGSYAAGATPEGIYDLAGNVAEWTADRYAPVYEAGPATDPQGPPASSTNLRVVRGGSYVHARFRLRGAARAYAEPGERRTTLGFRCVRSANHETGGQERAP
jgi:formylglycine-generating enzyme required for sulfatase activity